MVDLSGTKVLAQIVPPTSDDTFPTHVDTYGKGGFRSVADAAAMAAIPAARRSEGMTVYVIDEDKGYRLAADLVTWNPITTETIYVASVSDWAGLEAALDLIQNDDGIEEGTLYLTDDITPTPGTYYFSKKIRFIGSRAADDNQAMVKFAVPNGVYIYVAGTGKNEFKFQSLDFDVSYNNGGIYKPTGVAARFEFYDCQFENPGGNTPLFQCGGTAVGSFKFINCRSSATLAEPLLGFTIGNPATNDSVTGDVEIIGSDFTGKITSINTAVVRVSVTGSRIQNGGSGCWKTVDGGAAPLTTSMTIRYDGGSLVDQDLIAGDGGYCSFVAMGPDPKFVPPSYEIWVDPSADEVAGSMYTSLDDAADYINALPDPGRTLILRIVPGFYTEFKSVKFNKPVLVKGSGVGVTTIQFIDLGGTEWVRTNDTSGHYYAMGCFYWGDWTVGASALVRVRKEMNGIIGIEDLSIECQSPGLQHIWMAVAQDGYIGCIMQNLRLTQRRKNTRKYDESAQNPRAIYVESSNSGHGVNAHLPSFMWMNNIDITGLSKMSGTITTAGGDVNVVGTDTDFVNELEVGSHIIVDQSNTPYRVVTITDGTHLTVERNIGAYTAYEAIAYQTIGGIGISDYENAQRTRAYINNLSVVGCGWNMFSCNGFDSVRATNWFVESCAWGVNTLDEVNGLSGMITINYSDFWIDGLKVMRTLMPDATYANIWYMFDGRNGNHHVLNNVYVDGQGTTYKYADMFRSAGTLILSNVYVGSYLTNRYAIHFRKTGTNYSKIDGVRIEANNGSVYAETGCTGIRFINSRINVGAAFNTCTYMSIENCMFESGVWNLYGCSGLRMSNTYVYNVFQYYYAVRGVIVGNHFYQGIQSDSNTDECVFAGNMITVQSQDIQLGDENVFVNNVINLWTTAKQLVMGDDSVFAGNNIVLADKTNRFQWGTSATARCRVFGNVFNYDAISADIDAKIMTLYGESMFMNNVVRIPDAVTVQSQLIEVISDYCNVSNNLFKAKNHAVESNGIVRVLANKCQINHNVFYNNGGVSTTCGIYVAGNKNLIDGNTFENYDAAWDVVIASGSGNVEDNTIN